MLGTTQHCIDGSSISHIGFIKFFTQDILILIRYIFPDADSMYASVIQVLLALLVLENHFSINQRQTNSFDNCFCSRLCLVSLGSLLHKNNEKSLGIDFIIKTILPSLVFKLIFGINS
jgi:hypothetical protein